MTHPRLWLLLYISVNKENMNGNFLTLERRRLTERKSVLELITKIWTIQIINYPSICLKFKTDTLFIKKENHEMRTCLSLTPHRSLPPRSASTTWSEDSLSTLSSRVKRSLILSFELSTIFRRSSIAVWQAASPAITCCIVLIESRGFKTFGFVRRFL